MTRKNLVIPKLFQFAESQGWNDAELAVRMEVGPSLVCKWRNGTRKISIPAGRRAIEVTQGFISPADLRKEFGLE